MKNSKRFKPTQLADFLNYLIMFNIFVLLLVTGCSGEASNTEGVTDTGIKAIKPSNDTYHNIAALARKQEQISISVEKAIPEKSKTVSLDEYNYLLKKYRAQIKEGKVTIIPLEGAIADGDELLKKEIKELRRKCDSLNTVVEKLYKKSNQLKDSNI